MTPAEIAAVSLDARVRRKTIASGDATWADFGTLGEAAASFG